MIAFQYREEYIHSSRSVSCQQCNSLTQVGRWLLCGWCATAYSRALFLSSFLLCATPRCFSQGSKPPRTAMVHRGATMRLPSRESYSESFFLCFTSAHAIHVPAVLLGCCLSPWCEQRLENGERFHIMFAIQLIRCPFLNPRIRGVVILSNIIDVIVRNAAR